MVNIMIAGGSGFDNSGDEALLRACVQVCRDITPTSQLIIAANNQEVARKSLIGYEAKFTSSLRIAFFRGDSHYNNCDEVFVSRWNAIRDHLIFSGLESARRSIQSGSELDFVDRNEALDFWDNLQSSDALVIHGGGILTSATRSRLWEQALLVELACKLGKRVLLRSHQIGPFSNDDDRVRLRSILQHSSFVSSRDCKQSSREALALNTEFLVRDCVDDALILRRDVPSEQILDRHNLRRNSFICVGFRGNPGVGVTSAALQRTAEIVEVAYRMFRLPIALLPQGPFDMPALETLQQLINAECRLIGDCTRLEDPIEVASQARLMIACPHHSLIFALRGAVPILSPVSGDYYYFKNKGSMRFFDLEDFVFDIDAPNYLHHATEKLAQIFVEGDRLRHKIAMKVIELQSQSLAENAGFARALI